MSASMNNSLWRYFGQVSSEIWECLKWLRADKCLSFLHLAWARIILLKISHELANRCTCLIHTPTWSSKKCHLHSLLSGYPCSTCHAYIISSRHSACTIAGVFQPDPCYASTLSRSPMLGTKRSAWVTNPMIPTSYLKTHIRGVYEVNVADLKRER